MTVLEVRDLCVELPLRRQTLVALDNVSLAVEEGEILGLVGESGAGKSLTLDAIIGLLEPPARIVRGEIRLAGRRIDNLRQDQLQRIRGNEIGVVFQDPMTSLNPLYTIGHQLVQTIRAHSGADRETARCRAIDLLAQVGIPAPDRRFSTYPHQLSGGMRQRVVIALALCAHPCLILADEPTTALDVSTQAQILELLRELCREYQTAVVLISHDMGVIAETADRVAVIYAGRIVETGPVITMVSHPQHPYTRGLMNSIPSMGQGVARLVQIDGSMPGLAELPTGCPFHPRCPECFDRCRHECPALTEAGYSHSAACWLFDHAGRQD